ncbi:MAG: DJ-1/PfpI family protein [Gammaproteobacteria bacterium]|nr:MAG: DJ-1/PfpI family protein [Gammaproteobacteria bacterium]
MSVGRPRAVEILIFDGVEVLDFAGAFEVFSLAAQLAEVPPWEVVLVAETLRVHTAVNGLQVMPNRVIDGKALPAVLVVPGGEGTRALLSVAPVIAWLGQAVAAAEVTLSICSGARLLGAVGALEGRAFATHHTVIDELAAAYPSAVPRTDLRFVDTGRVVTTGGISAGIDGSLHLVGRLLGAAQAQRVADYMEYPYS